MHGGAKLKGEWSRLDHMYATEGAKQKEGPHIEVRSHGADPALPSPIPHPPWAYPHQP